MNDSFHGGKESLISTIFPAPGLEMTPYPDVTSEQVVGRIIGPIPSPALLIDLELCCHDIMRSTNRQIDETKQRIASRRLFC